MWADSHFTLNPYLQWIKTRLLQCNTYLRRLLSMTHFSLRKFVIWSILLSISLPTRREKKKKKKKKVQITVIMLITFFSFLGVCVSARYVKALTQPHSCCWPARWPRKPSWRLSEWGCGPESLWSLNSLRTVRAPSDCSEWPCRSAKSLTCSPGLSPHWKHAHQELF